MVDEPLFPTEAPADPKYQVGEFVGVRNQYGFPLPGLRRVSRIQQTFGGEFFYDVERTREKGLPESRLMKGELRRVK